MAPEDERLLGRPVQLCHQPRVSPAGFRWDADVALATWLPRAKRSFIRVWDLRCGIHFRGGSIPQDVLFDLSVTTHSPPVAFLSMERLKEHTQLDRIEGDPCWWPAGLAGG